MKIASMSSELIALGDNGFFYGWSWNNDGNGSLTVHPLCIKLLSDVCFSIFYFTLYYIFSP